jgi:hypothetical protein
MACNRDIFILPYIFVLSPPEEQGFCSIEWIMEIIMFIYYFAVHGDGCRLVRQSLDQEGDVAPRSRVYEAGKESKSELEVHFSTSGTEGRHVIVDVTC